MAELLFDSLSASGIVKRGMGSAQESFTHLTHTSMAHIVTMPTDTVVTRTAPSIGAQIVWFIAGIVEILLGLRFLLRLFGANPLATFSGFIYDLSAPLVQPFFSVFRTSVVAARTLEWPTLLAMLVHWLVAYLIVRLISALSSPTTP